MNETPLETAAEFLLRKRGRVRARWVVVPVALLGCISVGVAVGVGREHRPEFVPYTLALYGCTAFFVHAYVTAWRAGSFVWRYSSLLIALSFYAILSILHADDAVAWVVWSESGARPRPPQPALFLPITLNIVSGVLLTLHAFFLGLGSRAPTEIELTRIVKASSSGIMTMSTFDDDAAREVVMSAFAQLGEPEDTGARHEDEGGLDTEQAPSTDPPSTDPPSTDPPSTDPLSATDAVATKAAVGDDGVAESDEPSPDSAGSDNE